MTKNKKYEISSGNIFADIGVHNPEERLAKAELAYQINSLIQEKGLTQTAAAELLDIDQPKISALSSGKLSGFSLERLFRFLTILDQDITIKISPKKRSRKKSEIIVTVPHIKKSPASGNTPITRSVYARKKAKK